MRNLALLLGVWLASTAWLAPAQAQGLEAGDLVVSDLANARVLRVRPNGAVSVLSPRAGSGTNRLDAPTGIVVAPDRTVYVVDNDLDALIEIDPATGVQTEIPLFRISNGAYIESSTGQEPWGLALDDFGVLWVSASASNLVRRIGIATGVVETVLNANDLGSGGGPYGVWVKHDALETELIIANADAGAYFFQPGTEEILPPFDPSASVWDVDLIEGQLNLLLTLQRTPGSGAFSCGGDSGLYGNVLGSDGPLATGGLIRCPYAMVLDDDAIYITEAASTIGGGARVVRVERGNYEDSLFANLPDGASDTIPAGIAYVAAPEAASGAAGLMAFACLIALATFSKPTRSVVRKVALLAMASLAWSAPAHALSTGDLLVTDEANARVFRVQPNGAVSLLTPKAGSGPNLLEAPTGIVVTLDRRVFVVDNNLDALIEIDPESGAQDVIALFALEQGEYVESNTGSQPWGLFVDEFGSLWVSSRASNVVRRIGADTGVVETVITGPQVGTGAGPYGLAVVQSALQVEVVLANGANGVDVFSPFFPDSFPPVDPEGTVWDVELVDDSTSQIFSLQRTSSAQPNFCGPQSGIFTRFNDMNLPLTFGGLIRCPYAMVFTDAAIYVTETETTIGGYARIVSIPLSSGGNTVFADLADGANDTIPAGIAYVAAPEAASGITGLFAIACLWTLRRQAASRPIQLRS